MGKKSHFISTASAFTPSWHNSCKRGKAQVIISSLRKEVLASYQSVQGMVFFLAWLKIMQIELAWGPQRTKESLAACDRTRYFIILHTGTGTAYSHWEKMSNSWLLTWERKEKSGMYINIQAFRRLICTSADFECSRVLAELVSLEYVENKKSSVVLWNH